MNSIADDHFTFLDDDASRLTSAERIREISQGPFSAKHHSSELLACIPAFLVLSGWDGSQRKLLEALSATESFDLTSLRNTLVELGFVTTVEKVHRFASLDSTHFPAILITRAGHARILCGREGRDYIVYDPQTEEIARNRRVSGIVVSSVGRAEETVEYDSSEPESWLAERFKPLRRFLLSAFLLTFLSNLLALATPLGIMAIYDRVIGSGSVDTLYYIGLGIATALVLDLVVKRLRSATLDTCSARLGFIIARALFSRLINFPLLNTERTPLAAQLIRLRDLERVRSLVNGPLAIACMDLPYTVIFLVTIWALGGSMVLVPIAAFVIYAILGLWLAGVIRNRGAQSAASARGLSSMALEITEKMRALRVSGAEDRWFSRYEDLSRRNAAAGFRANLAAGALPNLSQTVASLAGLGTLAFGVQGVLAGTLTTGGLIASMILVWRVLGPMQGVFVALGRIGQSVNSLRQIDRLMKMPTEADRRTIDTDRLEQGEVEFDRVTFRYGPGDPELAGVSFKAQPGDVIAVTGRNGAGKSTVIKLISGLYRAQSGAVRLDGRDIRQFNPQLLRHSVAVMPQTPELVDGTIAENLRYAVPGRIFEQLGKQLCACAGIGS
ncbi:MAG: ABC transporter transmembrane domain-containing protein [Pseudomonadota bacterium]